MIHRPALALALAYSFWLPAAVDAGEAASFPGGDAELSGYLALPEGDSAAPGLVVIHEWWGLNDHIRGEAERLAKEGYVVLAVNLYRSPPASDRAEAHELMRGLPLDRADADLRAAFRYLAAHPRVAGGKVGSVGWCMGGGYSLRLAQIEPELDAAVVYYGRLATEPDSLKSIRAPVLGLFGSADRGIPVSTVRQFEAGMQSLDKPVEVHVYDGAGHAFARESGPTYDADAAKKANARTSSFLRENLAAKH